MSLFIRIWALISLTFRESLAKKTFIAFFTISTLVHLFFIFAVNVDVVDGALAMMNVFGKDIETSRKFDISEMIVGIESVIATLVYNGGIFLAIFAAANLVPTMLEKGNIELLVSKPLSRPLILLCRFIGAQSIMVFNVTYLVGGSWLILSMKTGFWHWPYLYSIPMAIAAFAIMYTLMALIGVTTSSTGVSIMVAYVVLFFSPMLIEKDKIYAFLSSKVYYYLLEGLYHALPKTFELGQINRDLVMGKAIGDWSALWTSSFAGLVILSLTVFIFSKKDF
ncbi:ABC transporter permease subunit [candidate division KSB1 bacterium]|nr:ABC transporter permease subunit [candidate division KSB1 bacterium]NIR71154.1 ABC transporter permease subunit [candidate division KSB1 bacterium]NIS23284.1 ABC transporter permease subunit [candidate division KSB1 bacterium]NIT70162.1 ABC transporter permease subunit [candidate division KSB1 bacterium]NIU23814.1 ABC transporter permease subunit [candidate division KSB1 bacterium]